MRAQTAPHIDGRLDDPAWSAATVLDGFVQVAPDEGKAGSERTETRILYDEGAVYVGIRCFDSRAAELRPRLGRRDYLPESDWVSIDLDTYHDRRSAFEFTVNLAGVQSDGVVTEGQSLNTDWDGVWEAQTTIDAQGWTAEIRIPFSTLRFPRTSPQSWGFHVRRYISRLQETDAWNLIRLTDASQIGHYEELTDLEDLRPGLALQLVPYGVMTVRASRSSGNLSSQSDVSAGVGLDAKYALTGSLTLDATINPDFAQVEVDPAVVNLTAFEVQFPEKRPFFLEGIDLFPVFGDFSFVYTRRMGAPPPLPEPRFGGEIVAIDPVARILGAVKLAGNLRPGTGVGVIGAFVDETSAVEREGGPLSTAHVLQATPQTWFEVVRLRQVVHGQSTAGVLLASAIRIHPEDSDRWQDAHVLYADFDLRGSSDWSLTGLYNLTVTKACDPRLSTTYHGHGTCDPNGGHFLGGKTGGEWQLVLEGDYTGPELDINDVAYFAHFLGNGDYSLYGHGAYVRQRPWRMFKNLRLDLYYGATWDPFAGSEQVSNPMTDHHLGFAAKARLQNDWNVYLNYTHLLSAFDDNETRLNPVVRLYARDAVEQIGVSASTNPSRPVSVAVTDTADYEQRTSSWRNVATVDVTFLVGGRLQLVAHAGSTEWFGRPRWVATGPQSGLPLFGTLHLDQIEATVRGTFAFSRDLTLQLFSQVLQSSQRYSHLAQLADPFTLVGCDVGSDCVDAMSPHGYDADFGSLIINAVARWEFRPGSTMFLVYTHNHQVNADLAALSRGPADNVLAVKLSVLWGL